MSGATFPQLLSFIASINCSSPLQNDIIYSLYINNLTSGANALCRFVVGLGDCASANVHDWKSPDLFQNLNEIVLSNPQNFRQDPV